MNIEILTYVLFISMILFLFYKKQLCRLPDRIGGALFFSSFLSIFILWVISGLNYRAVYYVMLSFVGILFLHHGLYRHLNKFFEKILGLTVANFFLVLYFGPEISQYFIKDHFSVVNLSVVIWIYVNLAYIDIQFFQLWRKMKKDNSPL